MTDFISGLTGSGGLSIGTFLGANGIGGVTPLLLILIPAGFTLYTLRKLIKGASKGKASI